MARVEAIRQRVETEFRRFLTKFDAILVRLDATSVLLYCLVGAFLVGLIDLFTDTELIALYLLPLGLASWYGGRRQGYVAALYCALAATFLRIFENARFTTTGDIISIIVRGLAYGVLAYIFSALRESRRRQAELTGFIVHDLRSPIASTITGLQTLELMAEDMDEGQKEMVNLATVSSQRALTLVNSILDVRKLESGQMEVNKESVDTAHLVASATEPLKLWAHTDQITIDPQISMTRAVVDPELTSRVLQNLLSNALKYSPEGGTVRVVVSGGQNQVRFAVEDDGPGIPPAFVETIFEPFTQVKGTKGGTGLGLAFCRLAVTAQGGRIWAESVLGQGTKMIFTIPQPHPSPAPDLKIP